MEIVMKRMDEIHPYMLNDNKTAMAEAEETLQHLQQERQAEEEKLAGLVQQYKHISDWAQEFDRCKSDEKKMILARLIEKITIDRDYHIRIYFFISLEEFGEHEPEKRRRKEEKE